MEDYLQSLFGTHGYTAAFVILVLCGLGLPLPEEVTLIGSGMLVASGRLSFWPATLVCSVAILFGDSIPFLLGRRYGERALRVRYLARILHPERFAKLRRRFEDHGDWATFSFRFFPGVRIPGYFLAGTLGMSYWRFLLLDFLGIAISVPASIAIGRIFADSLDVMHQRMKSLHLVFAFLALSLALIMIVVIRSRRERD